MDRAERHPWSLLLQWLIHRPDAFATRNRYIMDVGMR
jgi:hypothetical protein